MAWRRLGSRCRFSFILGAVVAVGSLLAVSDARAAITGLTRVASGLNAPMFVTHAPGDPNRLFIAERGTPGNSTVASASIRILDLTTGALQATPYLTIPGVDNRGEGGLLGMAFHPDFQSNGKFYVYITAGDSNPSTFFTSYIREYTAPSAASHTASMTFKPVLQWGQPQSNHNGGWIGFSPNDDYLYIMSGDGGGSDDNDAGHTPGIGNAQDVTNNLLGKALRIDVDGDDFTGGADPNNIRNYAIPPTNPFADTVDVVTGDDEIWAYGLRNPFRAGFDRATGDLWIGDVGQSQREEINFQPGSSDGGENYGWRLREGLIATPGVGGPRPPGNVDPIWDYGRSQGNIVLGGLPYRGPDPSLQGVYFFADTGSNRIWTLRRNGDEVDVDFVSPQLPPDVGAPSGPVAFGEDAAGNLYITYLNSGSVYRINTDEFTPGDFNGDAMVDAADLEAWKANFGAMGSATRQQGDADSDDDVDGADFLAWQRNLGWSPLNVEATASGSPIPEPAAYAMLIVAAASLLRRSRHVL